MRDAALSLDRDLSSRYRVFIGPGKPGKSWNFTLPFSRTGKPRSKTTGPEMPGNLFNLSKKSFQNLRYKKCMKTVRRIDFEILGMKGFKVEFGVLEKSIQVLEKSLKFISENGYEPCR